MDDQTDSLLTGLAAYAQMRDRQRVERVNATLGAMTGRERALVREAAVMGYVQGQMAAGGNVKIPPDSAVLTLVVASCLEMSDLYPTMRELQTGDELEDHAASAIIESLQTKLTLLDSAMHSVWLHGNWRWLTKNMTTEEREAAADAVDRYGTTLDPSEPREPVSRWWLDDAARPDTTTEDTHHV